MGEAGQADEGAAAGNGGGEGEGEKAGPVAAAGGGKVVGAAHPTAGDHPEGEHASCVEDEEDPGPGDQAHGMLQYAQGYSIVN